MMKSNFRLTTKKSLLPFLILVQMAFTWKAHSQDVIQVIKYTTKQTIWGFGGAANHPVQDLKTKLSVANQNIILDKLFRTDNDNAGLSIIRLEINGFRKTDTDPNSREQYTIEPSDGVWDWNTDQYQRWFAQEAINRSNGVHFMACPWSPPGWMKSSNSPINGGYLKTDCYDKFGTYMKSYVDHYRNIYGFDIRWVSIQNEPTNSTSYASCTYSNSAMNIVAAMVADSIHSLNQGVWVGAPEGATRGISLNFMNAMSTATKNKLDFIVTHDYTGASNVLAGFGKPVINTEVWSENSSDDVTITDGLKWANAIKDALVKRNEPGWLFWWLIDPNSGAQGIVVIRSDGTYTLPKRLYAMGQFSRFMREGDIRIETTSTNSQLAIVATKDSSGKASILVINNSSSAITATVKGLSSKMLEVYRTSSTESLTKLQDISAEAFNATVSFPAKSITTLIETTTCTNATPAISAPSDTTFEAGTGVQYIDIKNISDGDGCAQGITISAKSSVPNIVSLDSVDYTSCNETGRLLINPKAKGTAIITIMATDGGSVDCGPASKSVNLTIKVTQPPTQIGKNDLSKQLIYTNPVTDNLKVELINNAYNRLEIVDLFGRIKESLLLNSGQAVYNIDFSAYNQGVYFLKLSNDKETITRKVFKN